MFIVTLFMIAKMCKQPKCPSINKCMKKRRVYVHSGILLRHKMKGNNAICSNMDGPRDYQVKISQRLTLYKSLTCGIYKIIQMNVFTIQKQTHRHRKEMYGYQRGKEVEGGINQGFGSNTYTLHACVLGCFRCVTL